jgi:REP element-mobilizing transposase RayT
MARRPRIFAPGLLYHVIVRGNQRRKTFRAQADYQAYVDRLEIYRRRHGVKIYAYCLMPNHAHLLLETGREPLAKFMQGVQQSYTQYFNRSYRKVGHLFQGRYKAIVCDKDSYLCELVRYIHNNPVRSQIVKHPEQYRYSSQRAYLGTDQRKLVDSRLVLDLLGGRKRYAEFVMKGNGQGHKAEYYDVKEQRILGEAKFAEEICKQAKEEPPIRPKTPLADAFVRVARGLGVQPQTLIGGDRRWETSKKRALAAMILTRELGYRLTEVAKYLRRDPANVSMLMLRRGKRSTEH